VTEDLHGLVGLYVVDALDDDERARFEEHLAACEACAAEVAEFQATTSRLAALTAEEPPPALRASVLERIGTTRQASPLAPVGARRHRPSVRWVAPVLLAAAVIAVAVLTVNLRSTHRTLDHQQNLTAVLTAPDARTVPLAGSAPGHLRLVYSPSLRQSAVVADGVADVPPDQAYAMWFIGGDGPALAGLFRTSGGHAATVMDGTPRGYQTLGITVEPASGSSTPTTPVIFSGNVA